MFGGEKKHIKNPYYLAMRDFSKEYDDMPDGAFFALAEDTHNFDAEDWGWYSEVQQFDPYFIKRTKTKKK